MSRIGSRGLACVGFVACLAAGCGPAKVDSARSPTSPEPTGSAGAGGSQAPGGSGGSSGNGGFSLPPPGTTPPADAATGGVSEPEKSCAAQAFTPQKVPVDMHILVDSSLSMDLPAGNQSKWDRAIRALNTFITDPKSAGLGVGLTFFPNRTPTNVNTCRLDYYTTPAVTIAPLPMNAPALTAAINGRARCCDTATRPGMEGVFSYLRSPRRDEPRSSCHLPVDNRWLPNGCGPGNTVGRHRRVPEGRTHRRPSITTYAIGVFGDMDWAEGEAALNSWAMAGGSGQPFVLSASEDLGQKLVDALNEVRGTALACQFAVPNMPGIDFTKVNVRVTSNGGMR